MTARVGTLAVDGTPISQADLARIEAEEKLHADEQRRAVRVVAAGSLDADDCRTLLDILGLDGPMVAAARGGGDVSGASARPAGKRARKGRAA
jgi:hypothetical protein